VHYKLIILACGIINYTTTHYELAHGGRHSKRGIEGGRERESESEREREGERERGGHACGEARTSSLEDGTI
jgi:hypothetical protein